MKEFTLLSIILIIDAIFLLYGISELSISYKEASIFFDGSTVLHYITNASCYLFGQNDYALRLPFVFFHFISVILIYKIGKPFLKRKVDRLTSVLIYVMLPGVSAAALLVNEASLVILFTLLFIWCFQEGYKSATYVILGVSLFLDNSFAVLYLALFFYGIIQKDSKLFSLSLILFGLSMYMYGFDVHGKPKGYFMDAVGVYAATLSPLIFLYYIYAIYRIAIKDEKNILWYITFCVFIFTMLLSLRQRLLLEDFMPFAVIAVPLMVKVFFNSFRVRLPRHRRWHSSLLMIAIFSLSLNFVMTIFNKPIYHLMKSPNKHFVYKYHVAKELSLWLKEKGIYDIRVNNEKLAKRLKFYGIEGSSEKKLVYVHAKESNKDDFVLNYAGFNITRFTIK